MTAILNEHFRGKINLARVKFMAHFICALCKVRSVTFEKLAIDRTNWKFGETDINIFILGVVYQGVAFPLFFTMPDKRGNTNSRERIELVKRFIRLFGKECIDCLVADREFVGREGIGFLNDNGIRYHIRIRNNFKVWQPWKNKEVKAFWLFNGLRTGEFKHYCKIVEINGQRCYLSGCKLGKGDFLIIAYFNQPEEALGDYAQRWQIEMCFKAMKSSGFDIEATHLTHLERVEKLVLLVMVAFVWCYRVGIYLHRNVRQITVKKHGRKAKSIFKYGLDHVSNVLSNPLNQDIMNITRFLSCT